MLINFQIRVNKNKINEGFLFAMHAIKRKIEFCADFTFPASAGQNH